MESADAVEIDMVDSRWAPSRDGVESADMADLEAKESVSLASSLETRCNTFSIQ